MSHAWRWLGATLALAGLALLGWALWWVPPAGPPVPAPPPPIVGPAKAPPPSALALAVQARQPELDACLEPWRRAAPDAPAEVLLRIEAHPLPVDPVAGGGGYELRVLVPTDAAGRLVLEACAATAVQPAASAATAPEVVELHLGAGAG